jgi:hypothetical protein
LIWRTDDHRRRVGDVDDEVGSGRLAVVVNLQSDRVLSDSGSAGDRDGSRDRAIGVEDVGQGDARGRVEYRDREVGCRSAVVVDGSDDFGLRRVALTVESGR